KHDFRPRIRGRIPKEQGGLMPDPVRGVLERRLRVLHILHDADRAAMDCRVELGSAAEEIIGSTQRRLPARRGSSLQVSGTHCVNIDITCLPTGAIVESYTVGVGLTRGHLMATKGRSPSLGGQFLGRGWSGPQG